MRISGTEPSSVILSQRSLEYENDAKSAKTRYSQKGSCNLPTI